MMKIIAHEMPDGSVRRSTLNEAMLAWLQAGRSQADVDAFIKAQVAQGATESEASRLVGLMADPEREIKNRGGTPLAKEWAYALKNGGLSAAAALDLMARLSCPDAVRHVEVGPLPEAHAQYRAALKLEGNALGWSIVKAREVHRARLRAMRVPKFEPLERAQRTALATGNTAEALRLETQLQALRDVTADPRIAAAATVEELVSVIPDALK